MPLPFTPPIVGCGSVMDAFGCAATITMECSLAWSLSSGDPSYTVFANASGTFTLHQISIAAWQAAGFVLADDEFVAFQNGCCTDSLQFQCGGSLYNRFGAYTDGIRSDTGGAPLCVNPGGGQLNSNIDIEGAGDGTFILYATFGDPDHSCLGGLVCSGIDPACDEQVINGVGGLTLADLVTGVTGRISVDGSPGSCDSEPGTISLVTLTVKLNV